MNAGVDVYSDECNVARIDIMSVESTNKFLELLDGKAWKEEIKNDTPTEQGNVDGSNRGW